MLSIVANAAHFFFMLEHVAYARVCSSRWNVLLILELFFALECVVNTGVFSSRWKVF